MPGNPIKPCFDNSVILVRQDISSVIPEYQCSALTYMLVLMPIIPTRGLLFAKALSCQLEPPEAVHREAV